MHKLSTAVAQSSTPTALCFLGLLSASFHRYGGVRGERDGVEFAKRRRRDVWCIAEEEGQRSGCRPAATLRADGGCGRSLCRSSSPMSLTSPSPCSLISPRKTHQRTSSYLSSEALNVLHEYACGALPRTPCHRGAAALRHKNLCIIRACNCMQEGTCDSAWAPRSAGEFIREWR